MAKVKEINRTVIRKMCEDFEAAHRAIEEKYGVKIESGGGSFTSSNFSIKFKVSLVSEDGVVKTPERAAWQYAPMYSNNVLQPDDLDSEFKIGDQTFKIIGFKSKARKRPILTIDVKTNTQYVFEINQVIFALGRQPRKSF